MKRLFVISFIKYIYKRQGNEVKCNTDWKNYLTVKIYINFCYNNLSNYLDQHGSKYLVLFKLWFLRNQLMLLPFLLPKLVLQLIYLQINLIIIYIFIWLIQMVRFLIFTSSQKFFCDENSVLNAVLKNSDSQIQIKIWFGIATLLTKHL